MAISLSSLPCETRHLIYSLVALDRPRICEYATVSQEWRLAFERVTFSHLRLTAARLGQLNSILTAQRRRALQCIDFHVKLDVYDDSRNEQPESRTQQRRNASLFTRAVGGLFQSLALWDADDCRHGIQLRLVVDSSSDVSLRDAASCSLKRRARGSGLGLNLETRSLPYVDVVKSFSCTTGRHIEPMSILVMVSRFRNLDLLDIKLNHDSADDKDIWQRANFMSGLRRHAPAIRTLKLHRANAKPRSTVASREQQSAVFYHKLRRFSQQCESLGFDDCIDAGKFFDPFLREGTWPGSYDDDLYWPELERFKVRNSYLMQKPYLRVESRSAALKSISNLLVVIGRAASRMPRLRDARICQCVLTDTGLEWFVATYRCHGTEDAVLTIKGFMPAEAVVDSWRSSVAQVRQLELNVRIDVPKGRPRY